MWCPGPAPAYHFLQIMSPLSQANSTPRERQKGRNQGANRSQVGHLARICNAECGPSGAHPSGREKGRMGVFCGPCPGGQAWAADRAYPCTPSRPGGRRHLPDSAD